MPNDADELRRIERERLAALVAKDLPVIEQLHADDFHLINPAGRQAFKRDYVGGVADGTIDYREWEPESEIQVRLYGDAAVLRYQARLEIVFRGRLQPLQHYWHMDIYEKRDGQWQVVWSQATRVIG